MSSLTDMCSITAGIPMTDMTIAIILRSIII